MPLRLCEATNVLTVLLFCDDDTLSIVDAVIKAKVVRQLSMLLSKPCCHRSEEVRVLAREKDNRVNEKAHH